MTEVVRRLALLLAGVNVVGAWWAVRRDRPARFAGIRLPGTAAQHALTVGSAMSAPPVMLVAVVVATQHGRSRIVAGLAGLMFVGVLGEPDTWRTLRAPRQDLVATACALAEIAIPATILVSTVSC